MRPQGRPARRPARLLARLAGVLLLVVPFLPLGRLYAPGALDAPPLVPPATWLLGMFVFGASAWIVTRMAPSLPPLLEAALGRAHARLDERSATLLAAAILAGLLLLAGLVVFTRRPLLVDSVVQLFQARIFASGALTAPAPPGEAFVATQHMLVHGGRWFAQYPPGHAAMLTPGVLLGTPWLVPVLLSLGTALLLRRFAVDVWGVATGRVVLLLLLFAPFFWVMGASFMNHVSCLFFLSAFLLCYRRWEDGGPAGWALAAGLAIGAAGLARPLPAAAVAALFAPIGLVHAVRGRRTGSVMLAAAGGLVAAGLYLGYNAATTGQALVPGYLQLWGSSHGIGFHVSPWGTEHTLLTGLRNELVDLALLADFLLEWPIPALLPAGLYLALTGGRDRWDRRMAAGFLVVPAVYLFYWHRDAYLGPRYLYAGLAFLVPLTARSLLSIDRLPAGRARLRGLATALLVLCAGYAVLYSTPRRLSGYGSSLASMKVDVPELVRDAGIERGVVFVAVSWGNRLLARMREAGATASTAERVYRRADHCRIELTLRRGTDAGWSKQRFDAEFLRLPGEGARLGRASPNGDPTLRLRPGHLLAPVCEAELRYDAAGYGNWLPRLPELDPRLEGPILYVRDLRDLNGLFLERRPGRSAWLYRPSGLSPHPAPAGASAGSGQRS